MKKITATIPSVESHDIEYSDEEDLRNKVAEVFEIEKELFTLHFVKVKKENVITNVEEYDDSQTETVADDNLEERVIVDYLWARQMIELKKDQQKIRKSSATIVGAGALGNELAKGLALLGFGRMTIIDFDTIEMSNLNRTLFTLRDIGKGKAECLARKIEEQYPYTEVAFLNKRVEECAEEDIKSDVILSALDNMIARMWLTEFCHSKQIPLVDGGMKGFQARVQVMKDRESPCLACNIPLSQYSKIMKLRNPCQGYDEVKIASFPTVTSLVSAIQANEAMKIISGYNLLTGILVIDVKSNKYTLMEMKKNPKCMICGSDDKKREVKFEIIDKEEMNESTFTTHS